MKNSSSRMRIASVACALFSLSASARAEPTALQRSTAEALFQQGVALTQAERYAEACAKFEASLEIDRAIGTMLRLADCYDRSGKSASAWGLFAQVATLAVRAGDGIRAEIAQGRSLDLEKRLSLILFVLPKALAQSQPSVRIGNVEVPGAALDAPLPIDPGSTEISVSAAGHVAWHGLRDVPPGPALTKVEVPLLEPLPVSPPPPPAVTRSRPPDTTADPSVSGWSYVLGATGLVGLTAGGYFAYRAKAANDDSLDECRPRDASACTSRGVRLRDDARGMANVATVSFAAGGAALVAAMVIAIWGEGSAAEGEAYAVRPHVVASRACNGIELEGRF